MRKFILSLVALFSLVTLTEANGVAVVRNRAVIVRNRAVIVNRPTVFRAFNTPVIVRQRFVGAAYVTPTYVAPTFVSPTYVAPTFVSPTYVAPQVVAPQVVAPQVVAPMDPAPTDQQVLPIINQPLIGTTGCAAGSVNYNFGLRSRLLIVR